MSLVIRQILPPDLDSCIKAASHGSSPSEHLGDEGARHEGGYRVEGDGLYTIVMGAAWMPRINNTINILKSSIDTVVACVTQLETHQTPTAV
jgi:hypothetical protein